MRLPNLFLVGAPKCGTTWMTTCLDRHPDIFFSPKKEPLTLATDLAHSRKLDWPRYKALFEKARSQRYVAEGSVWYLYSDTALDEIARIAPDARIIIMIRDPVDLIRSLHLQFVKSGNEPILRLEQALITEEERKRGVFRKPAGHFPAGLLYTQVARCSQQIANFMDRFGVENVHVILYDDLAEAPVETARKVFGFLGLPQIPIDPTPLNVGGSYYAFGSWKFDKYINARLNKRYARLRSALPTTLRANLHRLSQRLSRYDGTMRPETSATLRQQFADERASLERLTSRDLSMWS